LKLVTLYYTLSWAFVKLIISKTLLMLPWIVVESVFIVFLLQLGRSKRESNPVKRGISPAFARAYKPLTSRSTALSRLQSRNISVNGSGLIMSLAEERITFVGEIIATNTTNP
jgi:hypothetical protein